VVLVTDSVCSTSATGGSDAIENGTSRLEGAFDDRAVEVRLCVLKASDGNLLVDGDPKADELACAIDRVVQVAPVQ
jgi:hypothetical protein